MAIKKKLGVKLRKSRSRGLFHNSREDVNKLSEVCNLLIDKVSELTDKVNELSRRGEDKRATTLIKVLSKLSKRGLKIMGHRLNEVRGIIGEQKREGYRVNSLNSLDMDWLIEQAGKAERYKKALKFYADKERYKEWDKESEVTDYIHDVDFDGGDIARKVLEG